MSQHISILNKSHTEIVPQDYRPQSGTTAQEVASDKLLPAFITKAASKQTYYTIRFLVDRERTLDAYRAYAYFRWVDDWLDERVSDRSERKDFIDRQRMLADVCYHGVWLHRLTDEERMLADLIHGDREQNSGLHSYVRNMMAVMAFDADRRGQLISEMDLASYTHHLSAAVTDALHYFIGHGQYTRAASRAIFQPLLRISRICCVIPLKTLLRAISTFPLSFLRRMALIHGM